MNSKSLVRICAMVAALSHCGAALAERCTDDAMIVFDGSSSMAKIGPKGASGPRIDTARRAMHHVMPQVAPMRRIGLLIYGPGPANGGCSNLDVRFAPKIDAAGPILRAVDTLQPQGPTSLAAAVLKAATVLDYRNRPGVVVLVTDGQETCGGAPCYIADELARTGHDITVHVIGFQIGWDGSGADCLAQQTGGYHVTADTLDQLIAALQRTLGCPMMMEAPENPAMRLSTLGPIGALPRP